jgi:hypothetical protein
LGHLHQQQEHVDDGSSIDESPHTSDGLARLRHRKGGVMYDASVLARLAGWSGGLRPVVTTQSRRVIRAGDEAAAALEVRVAGYEGGILQVESADSRILGFDRRAVVIDFRSGAERFRLQGSLEILSQTPPLLAALHPVTVPGELQPRKSVRVPTNVAVRLASADSPTGEEVWHTTTTHDLSTGGVRLRTVGDIRDGQRLRINLELANGPIELVGDVLEVIGDGTSRIRFVDVSESDAQRLLGHHVDLKNTGDRRDLTS